MNKRCKLGVLLLCLFVFWDNFVVGQPFSNKPVARLRGDRVSEIVYSPDGTLLAVGDSAGVRLYDTTTLTEVSMLQGDPVWVSTIAFHPGGRILAAGGGPIVRLWDVVSRQEVAVLEGHTREVRSVAFDPDGKLIASGSADLTVRLWDVVSRRELVVLKGYVGGISSTRGPLGGVYSVAFSPDGTLLAAGSDPGSEHGHRCRRQSPCSFQPCPPSPPTGRASP